MPAEFKEKTKKNPGMMKDEAGGKIIKGFIGLRASSLEVTPIHRTLS